MIVALTSPQFQRAFSSGTLSPAQLRTAEMLAERTIYQTLLPILKARGVEGYKYFTTLKGVIDGHVSLMAHKP